MNPERLKLVKMIRRLRSRISPDVLAVAQRAALEQVRQAEPEPENEASRLFKRALANDGAEHRKVLAYLENKFRHKLN